MPVKNMITLILICLVQYASGQVKYKYSNAVYDPYIKTVSLEVGNNPISFPILELNSSQFFILKFDDLLNEERNLFYRIIHCDKNWKPSRLTEIEYLSGFNDERLRNYDYSVNTKTQFIHYWQRFPNRDTNWKVSGNYLLVIYEDNIDYPLLTRRFIVTERRVDVQMQGTFPADVGNIRYKQEMQIEINFEKFKMRNPVDEVSIVVMQNEDWNTFVDATPSFVIGNNLRFNRVGIFQFFGLAEYREFDIRSIYSLSRGVEKIERGKKYTDVFLRKHESRFSKPHLLTFDLNGKFYIQNFEGFNNRSMDDIIAGLANQIGSDPNIRQTLRDSISRSLILSNPLLDNANRAEERHIRSDYAHVVFALEVPDEYTDSDIYIIGGINDWEPREEFKMKYNPGSGYFEGEALLKQGYYNFYYAIKDPKGKLDYRSLEGSWTETENDYHALVYYRGFGELYDRIIGYNRFNTELFNFRNNR
jgi:hypothetical protein